MKNAQLIIGLLAGTAIGGLAVASTGTTPGSAVGTDPDSVKKIVREVIAQEPELIIKSVQTYQASAQKRQADEAGESLKDAAVRDQVYNDKNASHYGPKDAKHVMAEFFDYNCGACKYMFKSIDAVTKKDKSLRIVFHEYPIFGPLSEANARIGLSVNRLYPDKYYDFHVKMMSHQGQTTEKEAYQFASELGMDVEKLKTEAAKPELNDILDNNRALGDKLHIQGTPTLVVGDEIVPHALEARSLEEKLNAQTDKASAKKDDTKETPKPE